MNPEDPVLQRVRGLLSHLPESSVLGEEARFGEVAIAKGFLSSEQLEEALREQERLRAAGEGILLGQLLLRKGLLSTDRFLEVLRSVQGTTRAVTVDSPASVKGPPSCRRLENYKLLREVGRGNVGVVFEAEDLANRRRVALKLLQGGDASAENLRRFYREATVTAYLQHPGIVGILDVGSADAEEGERAHYVAMEYVEGPTLADVLVRRQTPRRELLRMFEDVAGATAFAHSKGVVHGLLRPSIVLVGSDGRVRLTGFGSASTDLAGPDALPYLAPERAGGKTGEIDPREDVYALGILLCEILSGRPASGADTAEELRHRIVSERPPGQEDPAPDPRLVDLCLRAVDKDPERRPSTVAELVAGLRPFRAGEAVPSEPRRRRTLALAILLAALVVLSIALAFALRGR